MDLKFSHLDQFSFNLVVTINVTIFHISIIIHLTQKPEVFDILKYIFSIKNILKDMKYISSTNSHRIKNMSHFCLTQAPTRLSFSFNSRLLYELKYNARVTQNVWRVVHFVLGVVFIKVYSFVQQNGWTLWLENVIILFEIKIIEKSHMLFPQTYDF